MKDWELLLAMLDEPMPWTYETWAYFNDSDGDSPTSMP